MRVGIIGDGISSLSLAKALINENIYVDIFTTKKNNIINKSRTIGISKSNIEYFNSNILNIDKLIWKIKHIEIFSENLKNEKLINFESNDNQLFSILRNHQLNEILKKNLSKSKFFKKKYFKFNSSLIKNYEILIITDYSHSFTKKFFSKKIIKKYNSLAYTTVLKHEKILNNTATQIFTKNGPLAFLPISSNETSIVYSFNDHKNLKKENLENLIRNYNFKYKIDKFPPINSFELQSISLRSYYHDKILAFGDLLHRVHPLAGQGFNMTIRDIKILLDIIKKNNSLGLPLNSSVNQTFEKMLKTKNLIFSSGIDLIYEFFNVERKTKNTLLSKTIQYLGKNPNIKNILKKVADKGVIL
tara:strand:- start:2215 stop:3291 length:1077 start_codon:yes stop_codon:yes gene_type:complete